MKLIPLLALVFVLFANGCESPPATSAASQKLQEEAIDAIKKLGGKVALDKSGNAIIVTLEDPFAVVDGPKVTDDTLKHMKVLTSLRRLILSGTKISDAGLVHLKGLASLETLHLNGTKITDAGLAHLKGMAGMQAG